MTSAWLAIAVCVASFSVTMWIVRASGASLGLPLAYITNLLLIHVPGAYAYVISDGAYSGMVPGGNYVAHGMALTAIGSVCFIIGLRIAVGSSTIKLGVMERLASIYDRRFLVFCLLGGWLFAFGLDPLRDIPTVGAAINFGSAIWMLAVMIGLAHAVRSGRSSSIVLWMAALLVYPLTVLLFGGFLSYGTAAIIIVGSFAVIRLRSAFGAFLIILLVGYLGLSLFVNYFNSRAELRAVLWSGAGIEQRVDAVANTFADFRFFSGDNPAHLDALAQRLNQNEFVGLAADRLQHGDVEYLKGRSFFEGLIAPIPRAIWPDKPVFGGSGSIVRDMTGLPLSETTSWGVGNVMEFYINFGFWSLIPAFVALGFLVAWLDRKAATALAFGRPDDALIFFLPAVALIQPNGSLVELSGGGFAALLAAFGWRFIWREYVRLAGGKPQRPTYRTKGHR